MALDPDVDVRAEGGGLEGARAWPGMVPWCHGGAKGRPPTTGRREGRGPRTKRRQATAAGETAASTLYGETAASTLYGETAASTLYGEVLSTFADIVRL